MEGAALPSLSGSQALVHVVSCLGAHFWDPLHLLRFLGSSRHREDTCELSGEDDSDRFPTEAALLSSLFCSTGLSEFMLVSYISFLIIMFL